MESAETGRLQLYNEGFLQMDSIVDVYMLTYRCTYNGRKPKPTDQHRQYKNLDLDEKLVKKTTRAETAPGIDYGLE